MLSVALVRAPAAVLAGIGVVAAAIAACPQTARATDAAAPPKKPYQAAEDDYYTRRAKRVIEAERAALVTPHPLTASYPGKEIVVCEAGCGAQAPEVVFMRPEIAETVETIESVMVPTSTSAGRPVPVDEVACVAGCYGADRHTVGYAAPASATDRSSPAMTSVDDWTPPLRQRRTIDDKLSPVR